MNNDIKKAQAIEKMDKIRATNERLERTFNQQIGLTAQIHRESLSNDHTKRADNKLIMVGEYLNNVTAQGHVYIGSAAIHIYLRKSEILAKDSVQFAKQMIMKDVHEDIAIAAMQDFSKSLMGFYGHDAPERRSGF